MINLKFLGLFCICFIFVSGCARVDNTSTLPEEEIAFGDAVSVNIIPGLNLSVEGEKVFRIHYTLTLRIKNMTSDCVVFPHNFGVSIFFLKDEKWIGVNDLNEVINPRDIVLHPKGDLFSDRTLTIFPDYQVLTAEQPSSIRVLVSGRMCNDGAPTEQIVGNYVDVPVVP